MPYSTQSSVYKSSLEEVPAQTPLQTLPMRQIASISSLCVLRLGQFWAIEFPVLSSPESSTTCLSVCPSHSVSPSDSSLDSSTGFQVSCQLCLSLPFVLCCRDFWSLSFGVFPSLMHSYAHRHSLLPTKGAQLPWISCMPSSGQVGLPAAAQAYFVFSTFTLSPPLARFFLPSFKPWFGASSHLKPPNPPTWN